MDLWFIAYLIYTGKHTTKSGKELIVKLSKGMNNYRLSTFKSWNKESILPSLIDEVLGMDDIYVKNQDMLRINSSTRTLVKATAFLYIS